MFDSDSDCVVKEEKPRPVQNPKPPAPTHQKEIPVKKTPAPINPKPDVVQMDGRKDVIIMDQPGNKRIDYLEKMRSLRSPIEYFSQQIMVKMTAFSTEEAALKAPKEFHEG